MKSRLLPSRWWLLLLFFPLGALFWTRFDPGRGPAVSAGERPDIIIVVIETLRADHLQAFGHARLTMPVLERIASEGALFERATAPASWTLPSVASILTGLPPGAHGVRTYEDQIAEPAETLAERLSTVGYHTAFLGVNSLFEADRKVDQGFDYYYGTDEIAGEELNERLMGWLKDRPTDKPTFLYLHYFDPHCRYVPPPEYRELYWPPPQALRKNRTMTLEQYKSMHECFQLHFNPGEPVLDVDYYLAEYDAELRHIDHLLGLAMERLKTHGLYDSSLLFILGDHGEEFYEHGGFGHGKVLNEHQLHVPLVVRRPGGTGAGRRVPERVSLLDLYPTALAAAGIRPEERLSGESLFPLLEGRPPGKPRAVFAETDYEGKQRAVLEGRWKLIISPDGSRSSGLFDLEQDPEERIDRSKEEPEVRKRLLELLAEHEQASLELGKRVKAPKQQLTKETIEQLRSLGYTP